MKRLWLAGMGLAIAATAALGADVAPGRIVAAAADRSTYVPFFTWNWRLCRHQRRLRLRQLEMDRHRHPGLDQQIQASAAGWSAARSATTCSSKHGRVGVEGRFRLERHQGLDHDQLRQPPARPATVGSARRAGGIGYAFDRFLPYVTAGAAFGEVKRLRHWLRQLRRDQGRLDPGAGSGYAFIDNWTAKIEYLYVDLGKATCSAELFRRRSVRRHVQDQHRARRPELISEPPINHEHHKGRPAPALASQNFVSCRNRSTRAGKPPKLVSSTVGSVKKKCPAPG